MFKPDETAKAAKDVVEASDSAPEGIVQVVGDHLFFTIVAVLLPRELDKDLGDRGTVGNESFERDSQRQWPMEL